MADTSKKSYYEGVIKDSGLSPVTSEELQSKFNAITKAEYDKQRTDLQTATNKYYNQLYDTQQTTMDTIRQANAQAVASGASKGVQAANELSALLGLQSEAVTGATDLANQATTLAQEESQAVLENMLNAETQAAEQNKALAQILTQAGSVDVEQQNADTAKQQVLQQYWDKYLQAKADGDTDAADQILEEMSNYSTKGASSNTTTPPGENEQSPADTPVSTTDPKNMSIEQLKEALKGIEGRTGEFEKSVQKALDEADITKNTFITADIAKRGNDSILDEETNLPFLLFMNPVLTTYSLKTQMDDYGVTFSDDFWEQKRSELSTIYNNNDLTLREKSKRINKIMTDIELDVYRQYYKNLKK
jgi:hypothetical protein